MPFGSLHKYLMKLQSRKMALVLRRTDKLFNFVHVSLKLPKLLSKNDAVLHVIVVHIQVIAENKNVLIVLYCFSVKSWLQFVHSAVCNWHQKGITTVNLILILHIGILAKSSDYMLILELSNHQQISFACDAAQKTIFSRFLSLLE